MGTVEMCMFENSHHIEIEQTIRISFATNKKNCNKNADNISPVVEKGSMRQKYM